ncbi:MAG: ISNCY family transposase [Anaerolineaceae bacterium]
MDTITMSTKEISRKEMMDKLIEKRINQKAAAAGLRISVRQVKRLVKRFREEGIAGLISKQRGKPGHNRLPEETKQSVVDLLHSTYLDFGPTLAQEKLLERDGLKVSVSSVRKIMIEEEIWKPKKVKKLEVHQRRERRACFGELVQIDGSPHDWFEGRSSKCTLLVFIDDATGALLQLRFDKSESFFSYARAAEEYFGWYGKPIAFYSDKNGVFKVNNPSNSKRDALTQFGRAMQELGIQIICAETPQAKGRVERVIETLQDRLPKELRLSGINDPETGNAYLYKYMQDFNKRFAVKPRSSHNSHRPLSTQDDLASIFTWQEDRILTKNLTLQFEYKVYQIKTDRPSYALYKARVKVCADANGLVSIYYKGELLDYTIYHRQAKQALVVPSKQLDHVLVNMSKAHKPAPDHPWKKGFATPLSKKSAQKGDILI